MTAAITTIAIGLNQSGWKRLRSVMAGESAAGQYQAGKWSCMPRSRTVSEVKVYARITNCPNGPPRHITFATASRTIRLPLDIVFMARRVISEKRITVTHVPTAPMLPPVIRDR